MGFLVLAAIALSADQAMAQPGLLSTADTVIGIDLDSTFVGPQNNGRYPGGESPAHAIDGDPLTGDPPAPQRTKYLNFGGAGSGFIVTPSLPLAVESFQIRTGNDAPGRDPASWALYGFTGDLITTSTGPDPAINPTGLAEPWTLIDMGSLSLPGDPAVNTSQRSVLGDVVNVNSGGLGYQHYKMIFPTMKSPGSIMQIGEIQFFLDDVGAAGLLAPNDATIGVDETPVPAGWKGCPGGGVNNGDCSSFPGNEPPSAAIDQNLTTKYLNFGETNSGLIITNSDGPIDVNYMRITTANDAVERDPASYQLWGTNDPISSVQNSNSNGTETWTLISSGTLDLNQVPGVLPNGPPAPGEPNDDARRVVGSFIPINASASYSSYRLVFPTVKMSDGPGANAAGNANSMQISDVQFFTVIPEPASISLVALAGLALTAVSRRRRD
jgi:hypothetical protein